MTSRGPLHCRHVVVCTGSAALPKWSALALSMREKIPSLYVNTYRHPWQIKTRRVLVVGSGSSGTQICEDLARSRQFDEIILSVSGNRRFSWKVLGIPIHSIVKHLGLFDLAADAWLGRWIIRLAGNHGDPATPPAPAMLASQYGVRCVQKIQAFDGESIISKNGQRISAHDLTIIWCTGFRPDFTLLPESVQEVIARLPGWPIASHGRVPGFPGLHVLGQRFQSTLSSHILYGMTRDAARIARRIQAEMR
jgi:putative flavoprotein involved in K+ transport